MRVLVTGGAGFIGSNFIRRLLHEPRSPELILNLDKLTYAGNPENLSDLAAHPSYRLVRGDIGDAHQVGALLRDQRVDAVVNFAAESHVDRSIDSPEAFIQTNILGTFHLLETCRQYWKGLDEDAKARFRFLHVSTDEVFGSLGENDPPFSETTPFAPNSPYSASKASSDHLVRVYHHTYGFPTLTTNCSNNYGPYQFPEKLIPLMILNALEQKPLPVYGDGQNIRDWLYVEDHCRAIELALINGRLGETYNVGGLNEIKNLDIVESLCALLDQKQPRADGAPYKSQITFVRDRPGHDRRYAMNCRKIAKELGWCPSETFSTGLNKTVDWYLMHQPWCEDIKTNRYRGERLGGGLG